MSNPQFGAPAYPTAPAPAPAMEPPLWAPYYGISFPNAIVRFFKKYAVFNGRASRSEYWWIVLFNVLVGIVLCIPLLTWLAPIYSLATLVPNIALTVRRLHDSNHSGWWIVAPIVLEVFGTIVVLVSGAALLLSAMDGDGYYVGLGKDSAAAVGSLGGIFVGALIILVSGIIMLVLCLLGSKPEGARFDKPSYDMTMPYAQPMPGQAPVQSQPMQGQPAPFTQAPQGQPAPFTQAPQQPQSFQQPAPFTQSPQQAQTFQQPAQPAQSQAFQQPMPGQAPVQSQPMQGQPAAFTQAPQGQPAAFTQTSQQNQHPQQPAPAQPVVPPLQTPIVHTQPVSNESAAEHDFNNADSTTPSASTTPADTTHSVDNSDDNTANSADNK